MNRSAVCAMNRKHIAKKSYHCLVWLEICIIEGIVIGYVTGAYEYNIEANEKLSQCYFTAELKQESNDKVDPESKHCGPISLIADICYTPNLNDDTSNCR